MHHDGSGRVGEFGGTHVGRDYGDPTSLESRLELGLNPCVSDGQQSEGCLIGPEGGLRVDEYGMNIFPSFENFSFDGRIVGG